MPAIMEMFLQLDLHFYLTKVVFISSLKEKLYICPLICASNVKSGSSSDEAAGAGTEGVPVGVCAWACVCRHLLSQGNSLRQLFCSQCFSGLFSKR